MQNSPRVLQLTQTHRIIILTLIILQYILFAWSLVLMVNYHAIRIFFLDFPSMVSAESSQTHYTKNTCLYILFWLQHILMATLKYKISWFNRFQYFAIYDRYLYNISSGLTLWFIFSNLQPSFIYLFSIPQWICLPLSLAALCMLAQSMKELGGRILMPYNLNDIIHSRTLTIGSYEAKGLEGLKQSGIYAYVRNPMQGAVLIMMIFGNGIYTTERLVYLFTMGLGVVIGVFMEEKRMLAQFKDYKDYMKNVKARFIPFIPIL